MSLEVRIRKSFGTFELDTRFQTQGSCLGILGASGCGKSMTLKSIAGIVTPDEGRIVLNDRVLFDSERGIHVIPQDRKVGYLFQNYALFPRMNLRRNLEAGLHHLTKTQRAERVEEMIHLFRLEGLEDRLPSQLSGGQQQRVALARMLATRPEVLLLDEPFSALDSYLKEQLQFEVQKVLADYPGEVLMVTHSRDEVYRFCDYSVIMDQGHVAEQGLTRELFRHPTKSITARLSGCKNFSRARKVDDHHVHALDWSVILETSQRVNESVSEIGVRAHDWIPCTDQETFINQIHGSFQFEAPGPFETSIRWMPEGGASSILWKLDTAIWESQYQNRFPEKLYIHPDKILLLE